MCWQDLKEFLKKYNVVSLAVAFIMGLATVTLIQSFVSNIFMPLFEPLVPSGDWRYAVWHIGPVVMSWGSFLGACINFILMAVAVFFLVKLVDRKKK